MAESKMSTNTVHGHELVDHEAAAGLPQVHFCLKFVLHL